MSTVGRRGRVALAAGSVLGALVCVEVALRLFPPDRSTFEHRMHRIPHPTLGWVLEPGASYEYRPHPDAAAVRVRYSSAGWRDVEHGQPKPPGVFRIVVLGDSFMEAYSVALERSFSRRLEARARAEGLVVEVINLGVGGYGTLQAYLALREFGMAYAPDLVLLGFYVLNDVHDNSRDLSAGGAQALRAGARPFLAPDPGGGWEITAVDYEAARATYEARRPGAARGGSPLALRLLLERALDRGPRRGNVETRVPVHGCPEPPGLSAAWSVTERIFGAIRDSSGTDVVVFTVPGLADVDADVAARSFTEATRAGTICFDDPPGYERLSATVDALGIPLVDLLSAFRSAARDDARPLFHAADQHWNDAGHALAADLVFEALLDRGYLPGGPIDREQPLPARETTRRDVGAR